MSRRVVGRIIRPLQALADLTGTVQRERAFGQRVPGAEIKELNDLGTSFNALLEELDAWQTLMEGENQRLLHQARHDGLTGLANRAYFEGRLNRALSEAAQAGTGAAVLLIDCDKFKSINDGLGHAAGDAVLMASAGSRTWWRGWVGTSSRSWSRPAPTGSGRCGWRPRSRRRCRCRSRWETIRAWRFR
jgi:hypothetical protein